MSAIVLDAVAALRAGGTVIVPTDTVYGLAAMASDERAVEALYALKGRGERKPTAVLAGGVEPLLNAIPELEGVEALLRGLLPGPVTLIVANPARRLPWLCGEAASIGVRVPELPDTTRAIVVECGLVAATSANLPGGGDPLSLDDVPTRLRDGAVLSIDGGALPGTPSTVIDCSGASPVIVRRGAGDPGALLARAAAALGA